jgi:hypothetical protein
MYMWSRGNFGQVGSTILLAPKPIYSYAALYLIYSLARLSIFIDCVPYCDPIYIVAPRGALPRALSFYPYLAIPSLCRPKPLATNLQGDQNKLLLLLERLRNIKASMNI